MAGIFGFDRNQWKDKFPRISQIAEATDKDLKPWGNEDVEQFIKEVPEHGKNLKQIRDAGNVNAVGSAIGAATLSLYFFKASKSVVAAGVGVVIGGLGGFILSEQATTFTHGLYKINPTETHKQFYNWLEKKSS